MVDKGSAPSSRSVEEGHLNRPDVDQRNVRRGLMAAVGTSEPVTEGPAVVHLREGRGQRVAACGGPAPLPGLSSIRP